MCFGCKERTVWVREGWDEMKEFHSSTMWIFPPLRALFTVSRRWSHLHYTHVCTMNTAALKWAHPFYSSPCLRCCSTILLLITHLNVANSSSVWHVCPFWYFTFPFSGKRRNTQFSSLSPSLLSQIGPVGVGLFVKSVKNTLWHVVLKVSASAVIFTLLLVIICLLKYKRLVTRI